MSWLAIHIWFELLIAAGFGGLIGWALRARQSDAAASAADAPRIAELETQLRQEREDNSNLREKLEVAGMGAGTSAGQADVSEEATLAWRNRYLESRVRFLESKVGATEPDTAIKQDYPDETIRLRWRHRYLEGRVRYLEEELKAAGALPAKTKPAAENETT